MKKIVSLLFILFNLSLFADNNDCKSPLSSGIYIPSQVITKYNMRFLPVPISKENYSLLQSIGEVTNIIRADFMSEKPSITLISDTNADETVDIYFIWYPSTSKYSKVANPSQKISKEEFKKMKSDILNGSERVYPANDEGINYIKQIVEKKQEITSILKAKNGYRVTVNDADNKQVIRTDFLISNSKTLGIDLSFKVNYIMHKNNRIKPKISHSVYAEKSYDPYLKKVTSELLNFLKEYSIN